MRSRLDTGLATQALVAAISQIPLGRDIVELIDNNMLELALTIEGELWGSFGAPWRYSCLRKMGRLEVMELKIPRKALRGLVSFNSDIWVCRPPPLEANEAEIRRGKGTCAAPRRVIEWRLGAPAGGDCGVDLLGVVWKDPPAGRSKGRNRG